MNIKKTPLYEQHLHHQAHFFNFAGWEMPLHYGSQIEEHLAVRKHAGVFDVSHMGIIDIQGIEAFSYLRKVLANDIAKIKQGKALYSCMLNAYGGILDDLIVYQLGDNNYRLVVNAASTEKDLAWLREHAKNFNITLEHKTHLGILAVQGPQAISLLQSIIEFNVKAFELIEINHWMIARTGYTGEAGVEIILPISDMAALWQKIISLNIKPIGLGARDSLRLEAGFNLYGQDMDESVTPLESHLAWTVDNKDPERDFIGKAALWDQQKKGITQQLAGLVILEKGICRTGMQVVSPKGTITSGGFSPILNCGIALARIPVGKFSVCEVDIRGKKVKAKMITLPFVREGKSNVSDTA